MTDVRNQLEASIRRLGGTVLKRKAGTFAIVPTETFPPKEIPDADPASCTVVTEDGVARLSIPVCLPYALRGGVHIITPEHVAAIWQDLSTETLAKEYVYRCDEGLPIPPCLEDGVSRGEVPV